MTNNPKRRRLLQWLTASTGLGLVAQKARSETYLRNPWKEMRFMDRTVMKMRLLRAISSLPAVKGMVAFRM